MTAGNGGNSVFEQAIRAERGDHSLQVILPVKWNTHWNSGSSNSSSSSSSSSPNGSLLQQRFTLSKHMLQDFVVGLTFTLRQSQSIPAAARYVNPLSLLGLQQASADGSNKAVEEISWHEFVLLALRQVHCRALEDMMPEILLQTTCLLQQEEEMAHPVAMGQAHTYSP